MSEKQTSSNDFLPTAINTVGDRLGLDYNIDRNKATQDYIRHNIEPYCEVTQDQLKNTNYALDETRTVKKSEDPDKKKKKREKKPKNPLRLNSKKRKQLYKLKESDRLKYSTFEKINQIWEKYVFQVIKEGGDSLRLFRIDLHGCKLEIEASKNPTLIGHRGIVVQETKNTFIIIKSDDKTCTVPKKDSIFTFHVDGTLYRMYGSSLLFTTQNRTKVKFKQKRAIDEI